jgi:hypothetical protein
LHAQLESERAAKISQDVELTDLKSEILILKNKNFQIEQEKNQLKSELDSIIKQGVDDKQAVEENRNEEIDELVREIEHCINQLKQ